MDSRRRMATDERLLGRTVKCPECGRVIESNGHMYYDKGIDLWAIGYWCPTDEEMFPMWGPDAEPLIQEIAKDLDINSLPFEPYS